MLTLEKSADHDRSAAPRVPFPPGVRAAAIVWIGFGIIGLMSAGFSIALNAIAGVANPSQPGSGITVDAILLVLLAASFLVGGIWTIRGKAKGTLVMGICSIVLGLLYAVLTVMILVFTDQREGRPPGLVIAFPVVSGLLVMALLTAGMLAVSGRHAFVQWRLMQGHSKSLHRPRGTGAKQ